MDQSLEVFWDSFRSFYFLGVQKCKNQRFWWKNIVLVYPYQIEVQVFTNWCRWLKNTIFFKIWYATDFLHIFKKKWKNKKKTHIF